MVEGTAFHAPALEFCNSLVERWSSVYFSAFLRAEALQALVVIANEPGGVQQHVRRRFRLQHWGREQSVRDTWLRTGFQRLDVFVERFAEVNEIAFDRAIAARALPIMARFQIKSYDAIHVASAVAAGVRDIATVDADFLKIDDPSVATIHLIR